MNKTEIHYLSCQDSECEKIICVARRENEHRTSILEHTLKELIETVDECLLFDEQLYQAWDCLNLAVKNARKYYE